MEEMSKNERSLALSVYLIALALLESNEQTYVRREIQRVMDEIELTLSLNK